MRFLLFFWLSTITCNVFGQSKIDSLQLLIDREKESKRKVELLNALSFVSFNEDIERSNTSTEQALQLSRKIGDQSGEGWALAYRGLYYFFNGNLPTARSFLDQALSLGQRLTDQNLQVYSLTQIGNVYRDKGVFDSAFQFYRQAKQANSKKPDAYYESIIKMNIGRCYLIIAKPDSALQIAKEVVKIREKMKGYSGLADALILMGNSYLGKENFSEAERYYELTRKISAGDPTIEADYSQGMGEVHFKRGDFQAAMKNWTKVLAYHRQSHYKYGLASLLLRMGKVFNQQGFYDLAIEYLTNALEISEKASYRHLAGQIIYEQAWVYYRSKSFDQAVANLQKAEAIFIITKSESEIAGAWDLRGLIERRRKNYNLALFYHKKSLAERVRLANKVDIDAGLFNIGEYYLATKKFETALPYYFKSLKMDSDLGDNYGKSLNYNRLGNIYTHLSRFDSAKFYLEKSMELAIPISANEVFRDNYRDFAAYYEKVGKLQEAIRYFKIYNQLSDSIFNKQTAQSLASYRILYEVERNEQQIELLNKDNLLK